MNSPQARAEAIRIVDGRIPQALPQSRWEGLVNDIAAALERAGADRLAKVRERIEAIKARPPYGAQTKCMALAIIDSEIAEVKP